MKAVVEIDIKTTQAKQLLSYIKTLPFAKVKTGNMSTQSAWSEVLTGEGVSIDELKENFKEKIFNAYDCMFSPRRTGSLTEGYGFWVDDVPFDESNYRDLLWQTEKNVW